MEKANPKLRQSAKVFPYVKATAVVFWGCANIAFLRACTF